ncbi:amidase [Actinoplanes hulinensis]|uniref:Amidase n=1 Tax=Actinoplanes hulinensis TaxID=1144547 RepID=A0ABS7AXH2_9ACTN|nr:amidase [Actinoplanes hulinensis]MBW6433466.1 amidase [Actinoplanes hulinensis]
MTVSTDIRISADDWIAQQWLGTSSALAATETFVEEQLSTVLTRLGIVGHANGQSRHVPYGAPMSVWISRIDPPSGAHGLIRVAVKDAIDVAGTITTAGCAAVRDRAVPATSDAQCLVGLRSAGAVIVGKTTLTELCVSPVGDNPLFGTPVNPVAPDRIPGGSSSGSAVAVATGEADIGLGTDTGGSVRIPAACCGVVGLKTTWGRVPTHGVWPLAPSLDTVGPLARDVAGVATGMRLLEPDWTVASRPAGLIGRVRIDGVDAAVEDLVDATLRVSGLAVHEVRLPGWDQTWDALDAIILGELWNAHHALLDADGVGAFINDGLHAGRTVTAQRSANAMSARAAWQAEVTAALGDVDVLALPTLIAAPPLLADHAGFPLTQLTAPFNLAGVPALSMPIPSPGFPVPVSLQLVGPMYGEDLLCATGLAIEEALTPARR